jgi:hypothetical protein
MLLKPVVKYKREVGHWTKDMKEKQKQQTLKLLRSLPGYAQLKLEWNTAMR